MIAVDGPERAVVPLPLKTLEEAEETLPLEALTLPDDDPELLRLERLGDAVTTSVPPTKTSKAESIDTASLSIVIGIAPGVSVVLSMMTLVGFTVKVSVPTTMVSSGCGAA